VVPASQLPSYTIEPIPGLNTCAICQEDLADESTTVMLVQPTTPSISPHVISSRENASTHSMPIMSTGKTRQGVSVLSLSRTGRSRKLVPEAMPEDVEMRQWGDDDSDSELEMD